MRATIISLLLLALTAAAFAGPQRSPRRFLPRRGNQDAATASAAATHSDAPAVVAEDESQLQQEETPRFKPRISSGSGGFRPKSSQQSFSAPVEDSPSAVPVASHPQEAKFRSRGTTTFLESLRKDKPDIDPAKLAELGRAVTTVQSGRPLSTRPASSSRPSSRRISSRPSSRPSGDSSVSQSPSKPSLSSRPASSVTSSGRPSIRKNEEVEAPTVAAAKDSKTQQKSANDQSSRRQRLLQIKKRPRPGKVAVTEKPKDVMEKDMAVGASTPELETEVVPKITPKLDEQELVPLDMTIKKDSAASKPMPNKSKQMMDKLDDKVMADDIKSTKLDAADPIIPVAAEEPSTATTTTTTTTVAPAVNNRKLSSLTRLRASRPASRQRSSGPGRVRASTPVVEKDGAATTRTSSSPAAEEAPVQPRLSSRRGGRGNSRGGAALANSGSFSPRSRTSSRGSIRSRAPASPATDDNNEAAVEAPAPTAGGSRFKGGLRDRLGRPSRRRKPTAPNRDEQTQTSSSSRSNNVTPRKKISISSRLSRIAQRRRANSGVKRRTTLGEQSTKVDNDGEQNINDNSTSLLVNNNRQTAQINKKPPLDKFRASRPKGNTHQIKKQDTKMNEDDTNEEIYVVDEDMNKQSEIQSQSNLNQDEQNSTNQLAHKVGNGSQTEIIDATTDENNLNIQLDAQVESMLTIDPRFGANTETRAIIADTLIDENVQHESTNNRPVPSLGDQLRMLNNLKPENKLVQENGDKTELKSINEQLALINQINEEKSHTDNITIKLNDDVLSRQSQTTYDSGNNDPLTKLSEISSRVISSSIAGSKGDTSSRVDVGNNVQLQSPISSARDARKVEDKTNTNNVLGTRPLQIVDENIERKGGFGVSNGDIPLRTRVKFTPNRRRDPLKHRRVMPSSTSDSDIRQPTGLSNRSTLLAKFSSATTTVKPTPTAREISRGGTNKNKSSSLLTRRVTTSARAPVIIEQPLLVTAPTTTTTKSKRPRVAPEKPEDREMSAVNRGGFRFRPHESSDRDITRRRGEVVITQVGTLEDTPPQQVATILAGLGGRRRGLARPPLVTTDTAAPEPVAHFR